MLLTKQIQHGRLILVEEYVSDLYLKHTNTALNQTANDFYMIYSSTMVMTDSSDV